MRSEDVLVIVLGGRCRRAARPLTRDRAKPAVYFGGPYRIIDFVLNCINSGLRRVFIATPYSRSPSTATCARAGAWSPRSWASSSRSCRRRSASASSGTQGTTDAVYQNIYSIVREEPRCVVILAGDHVYKMDYLRMVRFHQEMEATVTLAAIQ